jgi:ubiquinone/menaquinone biosynthesis C-methylase UbiE
MALGCSGLMTWASLQFEGYYSMLGLGAVAALVGMTVVSLVVSCYVYDLSGLYQLAWMDMVSLGPGGKMANIHAGLDETTTLLRARYPKAEWTVMDFYDAEKHTEISIKRARRIYPPSPKDLRVNTSELPLSPSSMDAVFVVLAAHEIRNEKERVVFFKELHRVLKPEGIVVVLEHLRNIPNFLAYAVGALHFISRKSWHQAFERAQLRIAKTICPNPFMTCFILERHELIS